MPIKQPLKKQRFILAGCRVTAEEYAELNIAAMNNNRTIAGEIRSRIFRQPTEVRFKPSTSDTAESAFKK